MDTVTVTLELSDELALALAQFVKRCSWSDFRTHSVDDTEAQQMKVAVDQLQRALAAAGYAPR